MTMWRQGADGEWRPLDALPVSRRVRFEVWCRAHRLTPLARLSVWLDERRMG